MWKPEGAAKDVTDLLMQAHRRVLQRDAREIWMAADLDLAPVLDDIRELAGEARVVIKEVGRNKLDGGSLDFGASPAVADGRLYLRSRSYLYCIGGKK